MNVAEGKPTLTSSEYVNTFRHFTFVTSKNNNKKKCLFAGILPIMSTYLLLHFVITPSTMLVRETIKEITKKEPQGREMNPPPTTAERPAHSPHILGTVSGCRWPSEAPCAPPALRWGWEDDSSYLLDRNKSRDTFRKRGKKMCK